MIIPVQFKYLWNAAVTHHAFHGKAKPEEIDRLFAVIKFRTLHLLVRKKLWEELMAYHSLIRHGTYTKRKK
jgi:hypothetical protein